MSIGSITPKPGDRTVKVEVFDLGLTDYQRARMFQLALVGRVRDGDAGPCLVLAEHPPVITVGRSGKPGSLLSSPDELREHGIGLHDVERGGDITCHEPGQLVCYPIMNLTLAGKDLYRYLRMLEEVVIKTLADHGIAGERIEGRTGIWVERAKVAAIGIAVRHWVSFHGFALNVCNTLRTFSHITPCGIPDATVTSMSLIKGSYISVGEVKPSVVSNFKKVFSL